jgi:hypothetical protein
VLAPTSASPQDAALYAETLGHRAPTDRGHCAVPFATPLRLKVIKSAVSLVGTESPMTHSNIPVADEMRFGTTPALIRVSIGIENPNDLIADLDQALEVLDRQ